MIVGVTGTSGAGKRTIAEFLKEKGFKHYSVRELIIKEIKKRGLEFNRENFVEVANSLRRENGSDYFMRELYDKAKDSGDNAVIESIRTVDEAMFIKNKGDSKLVSVDADPEIRYLRLVESETEEFQFSSFEEFLIFDEREKTSNQSFEANLISCMELADYSFKNDWTLDDLKGKFLSALGISARDLEKHKRPSWDEVFMANAILASSRASCWYVQAGAVVVKNNRVLSTGYNGAPPGIKNSMERGYCSKRRSDGSWVSLDEGLCIGAHAETNSLANLPMEGAKGGTLYTTVFPCNDCIKAGVLAYGLKRVVFKRWYDSKEFQRGKALLIEAGVKVERLDLSPNRFLEIITSHPAKKFSVWTEEEKKFFDGLNWNK